MVALMSNFLITTNFEHIFMFLLAFVYILWLYMYSSLSTINSFFYWFWASLHGLICFCIHSFGYICIKVFYQLIISVFSSRYQILTSYLFDYSNEQNIRKDHKDTLPSSSSLNFNTGLQILNWTSFYSLSFMFLWHCSDAYRGTLVWGASSWEYIFVVLKSW